MAPPRQSRAGIVMLSTIYACLASLQHHQRHRLRQVLPPSLSFKGVLQAHDPTKALSRRYCHPHYPCEKTRKDYAFSRQFREKPSIIPNCPAAHYPSHVSCKPMTQPRQSHAGIDALAILHVCHASPRHNQSSLTQVSPPSLSFICVL